MTTEQARKEIVEDVLNNRDELRRALIEGLEKDVGDGFLDALLMIIRCKTDIDVLKERSQLGTAARFKSLILSLEDIAISYANSVNISEDEDYE